MSNVSNNINEIQLLNKQLDYLLSMKGGGKLNNIKNFKTKLENHKKYLFIVVLITCCIIIYNCIKHTGFKFFTDSNKKMTGGKKNCPKLQDYLKYGEDAEDEGIYQFIVKMIMDFIYKIRPPLQDGIKSANSGLASAYSSVNTILYRTAMIPVFIPIQPFFVLLPPVYGIILYSSIFYLICNAVLSGNIYIPCSGCQEDGVWYTCTPGTGKDSITCKVLTEIYDKLKLVLSQFDDIKIILVGIKKLINLTIKGIIFLIKLIYNILMKLFDLDFAGIFSNIDLLSTPTVADSWGVNLGKYLICSNSDEEGMDCVYKKNGKLKDNHGNNKFLNIFWKAVKFFLELPAPFPSLGVAKEFKDIGKLITGGFDKDSVFKALLETLVMNEINPVKWILQAFIEIIKKLNVVFKFMLNVLSKSLQFIVKLFKTMFGALINLLYKLIKEILSPLDEFGETILFIPKKIYGVIKNIYKIGPHIFIIHAFYNILIETFPFLDDIRAFTILITIIFIVLTILIWCPIIGCYYYAYKFGIDLQKSIQNNLNNLFKGPDCTKILENENNINNRIYKGIDERINDATNKSIDNDIVSDIDKEICNDGLLIYYLKKSIYGFGLGSKFQLDEKIKDKICSIALYILKSRDKLEFRIILVCLVLFILYILMNMNSNTSRVVNNMMAEYFYNRTMDDANSLRKKYTEFKEKKIKEKMEYKNS